MIFCQSSIRAHSYIVVDGHLAWVVDIQDGGAFVEGLGVGSHEACELTLLQDRFQLAATSGAVRTATQEEIHAHWVKLREQVASHLAELTHGHPVVSSDYSCYQDWAKHLQRPITYDLEMTSPHLLSYPSSQEGALKLPDLPEFNGFGSCLWSISTPTLEEHQEVVLQLLHWLTGLYQGNLVHEMFNPTQSRFFHHGHLIVGCSWKTNITTIHAVPSIILLMEPLVKRLQGKG